MRTGISVEIDARPEHVWAVLCDVSRWPDWTSAVREVRLLDGPVLAPGSTLRVRAAGLPDRTWRVTGHTRGRSFTWSADGLGAHAQVVFRLVAATQGGRERTRLHVEHERLGWLAGAVQRVTARTTSRHLRELVEGLRRRCEDDRV